MTTFIFVIMAVTIITMAIANASAQSKLKTRMQDKRERYRSLKTDADGKYPLVVRNSFLNYNEMPFFEVLQLNMPSGLVVCPKVSLYNIVALAPGGKWTESDLEKLIDKRLDFLLCDSSSLKPLLGIELGLSAVSEDQVFMEKACKDAGLKFVRFPSKDRYSGDEIGQAIAQHLDRARPKDRYASLSAFDK